MKHKIRIAVIGARNATSEGLQFAYEIGRLLARKDVTVYTGGSNGIMEAASRGVKDENGIAVGIIKESDISGANDFVTIPVLTGIGDLRNGIIIRSVQGAIAVEGAYGTLSEIAYALSDGKPVVAFNSWDIPGVTQVKTPEEAVNIIIDRIGNTSDE